MTDRGSQPTWDQAFVRWWNSDDALTQANRPDPEHVSRAAWQASRRRTLEEVIAKLRKDAPTHDDGMYGGIATFALNKFADELESELKAEKP